MHLCQIDVPGFDANHAFDGARAYLLDRFPEILDVLPTRRPATLVIGYRGPERLEAWAEALDRHRGAFGTRARVIAWSRSRVECTVAGPTQAHAVKRTIYYA